MANTVRIKRRAAGGAAGAPSSLENAELAYNEQDDTLYYGKGTGGAGGSASQVIAIAGPGTYARLDSPAFTGTPTAPTPSASDDSTRLATTAYVKAQAYLNENQTITLSGDVTGSGKTAITVTLSNSGVTAGTYTKVTVDAKGRVTAGDSLVEADIPSLHASKISDFDTQVRSNRLDQLAAPTTDVSMNGYKLTNLAEPTSPQDAATKNYVDMTVQGLDPKASVKAATTSNIASLSGTMTIDGVALSVGDRVLVKDQTTASQNGIYVVGSGPWVRADDADTWEELVSAYVFAEQGTVNAEMGFICTVDAGGTLGTSAVSFQQFNGAGQITAGAGLTKTGNTINVVSADSGRIVVNADSIDLATTGVSAGDYTKVSVDGYGRMTGGSNPTTLLGYGITDAQPLDATLTALAALVTASDKLIYATGSDAFATIDFPSFGRSLASSASAAAARTTLGLGTIATQDASNVSISGGSISGISLDGVTVDGGTF